MAVETRNMKNRLHFKGEKLLLLRNNKKHQLREQLVGFSRSQLVQTALEHKTAAKNSAKRNKLVGNKQNWVRNLRKRLVEVSCSSMAWMDGWNSRCPSDTCIQICTRSHGACRIPVVPLVSQCPANCP